MIERDSATRVQFELVIEIVQDDYGELGIEIGRSWHSGSQNRDLPPHRQRPVVGAHSKFQYSHLARQRLDSNREVQV